jgi:hypothetical protein
LIRNYQKKSCSGRIAKHKCNKVSTFLDKNCQFVKKVFKLEISKKPISKIVFTKLLKIRKIC